MTGIERLVDIVNDGPYSGGMIHISVQKLRDICEQIEREADDISGYASDVLAFVEELGGMEAIKEWLRGSIPLAIYDQKNRRIRELENELEDMRGRLMPEGIKWPMFEDNELVGFGDEYVNAKGNVSTLRTIVIKDCRDRLGGGYYWKLGKGACAVVVKNGERIKRPPVLAADGKPLESGQTVYLPDGTPLHVTGIGDMTEGHQTVFGKAENDIVDDEWDAVLLTHQRLVLDADGVPIKVGDTVWRTSDAREFEVTGIDGAFAIRVRDESMEIGVWTTPCGFTHTNPEPTDTWERIEKDKDLNPFDYCKKVGHHLDTCENAERYKSRDLVRRAKALAGKED